MSAWKSVTAILGVALAATGCDKMRGSQQQEGTASKPASQPASAPTAGAPAPAGSLLIGEFGSLTRSEATLRPPPPQGILPALEGGDGAGGVKGKQLTVKVYDDQGKSQEAGTAVARLITDDKVIAVLGEVASSLSIAGGRVAQQYKIPMISPSSTNPQVTAIGDMIFRV